MINDLCLRAKDNAEKHGFHNDFWQSITLIHSELSEAVEAFRVGHMETTISMTGKPEGVPSELADAVIRIFNLAGAMNIDLEKEILLKMDYNETRPFKHGNKSN